MKPIAIKPMTKERLNTLLQRKSTCVSGIIEFDLDLETSEEQRAIADYIGFALATKGLVYWPVSSFKSLIIGFRPFMYDLDTSLLGSICH